MFLKSKVTMLLDDRSELTVLCRELKLDMRKSDSWQAVLTHMSYRLLPQQAGHWYVFSATDRFYIIERHEDNSYTVSRNGKRMPLRLNQREFTAMTYKMKKLYEGSNKPVCVINPQMPARQADALPGWGAELVNNLNLKELEVHHTVLDAEILVHRNDIGVVINRATPQFEQRRLINALEAYL